MNTICSFFLISKKGRKHDSGVQKGKGKHDNEVNKEDTQAYWLL